MRNRNLSKLLLLVLILVVTTTGCSDVKYSGERKPTKVVLLGVDGLEPRIVESLMEQGRLPVMKRLMDNGAMSTISCVAGMCSPVVWTTVATGVMPEEHGIPGFVINDVLVTSTIRKVPAFWNMLAQSNIVAATLGWMVTWPAENDSGIIISDRAYWGKFEDKIKPDDALNYKKYRRRYYQREFDLTTFTNFAFDPDYESLPREDPAYATNFLIARRLTDAWVRDTIYKDMAIEIGEKYGPEVMAVYFQGIDYTGHGFWKWFESTEFAEAGWTISKEDMELLKDVVPRYYEYTDNLIGQVLDGMKGDPLVILISDHGFGPRADLSQPVTGEKIKGETANLGDFISGNHRDKAVLIMSGPQVRGDVEPLETITHLDILPTMLYALGLASPDPLKGRVLKEFFHESFQPKSLRPSPVMATTGLGESDPLKSEHDEAIMENLRSLGYVK